MPVNATQEISNSIESEASKLKNEAVRIVFATVYTPNDLTIANSKDEYLRNRDYLLHPSTMITSFLGLPNYKLNKRLHKQTAVNIFYNFIGWKSDVSTGKKVVNILKAIPTAAFNLLSIGSKLAVNILALFTEFLPRLGILFFKKMLRGANFLLNEKGDAWKKAHPIQTALVPAIARTGLLVCRVIDFVGTAITSPIKNLQRIYSHARVWVGGGQENQVGGKRFTTKGKIATALLMFLSAAITITVYTFLFPVVLKYLMVKVVPAVINHLPHAIVNAVTTAQQALSPAVKALGTFFDMVGKFFTPVFEALGLSNISTAAVGFSLFVATVVTTLGNAVSKLAEKITKEWLKSKVNKGNDEIVPVSKEVKNCSLIKPTHSALNRFFEKIKNINIGKKPTLDNQDMKVVKQQAATQGKEWMVTRHGSHDSYYREGGGIRLRMTAIPGKIPASKEKKEPTFSDPKNGLN